MQGTTSESRPEWLRIGEAARILGVSPDTVRRMGERGLLTMMSVPGSNTRYARADVERVAQEALRPAGARTAGVA